MFQENQKLEVGIATVTAQGLLFFDKYYSSPLMTKNQWFEEAQKNGEWKLPVFFNTFSIDILIIMNFSFTDFAFVTNKKIIVSNDEMNT